MKFKQKFNSIIPWLIMLIAMISALVLDAKLNGFAYTLGN
jgi:hypothetical protein